mmetsp:Transcript_61604/g.101779  ORF Transcript_61604/g.101779 Transcript_61604/m.101779 type:complete len:395 (-) Transcript_61604:2241-3425(-)
MRSASSALSSSSIEFQSTSLHSLPFMSSRQLAFRFSAASSSRSSRRMSLLCFSPCDMVGSNAVACGFNLKPAALSADSPVLALDDVVVLVLVWAACGLNATACGLSLKFVLLLEVVVFGFEEEVVVVVLGAAGTAADTDTPVFKKLVTLVKSKPAPVPAAGLAKRDVPKAGVGVNWGIKPAGAVGMVPAIPPKPNCHGAKPGCIMLPGCSWGICPARYISGLLGGSARLVPVGSFKPCGSWLAAVDSICGANAAAAATGGCFPTTGVMGLGPGGGGGVSRPPTWVLRMPATAVSNLSITVGKPIFSCILRDRSVMSTFFGVPSRQLALSFPLSSTLWSFLVVVRSKCWFSCTYLSLAVRNRFLWPLLNPISAKSPSSSAAMERMSSYPSAMKSS